MTIRDLKGLVEDRIPVQTVLISVFDKSGLEELIPTLMGINPGITFLSTGGTYGAIRKMLGDSSSNRLVEVAEYTQFPEMEGGLVKTLHPKIHAGILGERNNPEHQKYLAKTLNNGVYIDMVVVNLYPFQEMVRKIERGEIDLKTGRTFNFESGRGNIDIGGPTMIRAAAKNFPSCAVMCNPTFYESVLKAITHDGGSTTFDLRLMLAREVFRATAAYDSAISAYFEDKIKEPQAIKALYQFNTGD